MPTPRSDEQLLGDFAKGDTASLGELAQRYEPLLLGLARGLLSGRDDLARDVVQETWIRVIKYARHFESRSSAKTWLYRIVVNKCHDAREATKRQANLSSNGSLPSAHDPAPDLDNSFTRLLDAIPDSVRLILLLCHHQGLTHEQAAEVLGIPVGTLKSRQHAALQHLREVAAKEANQ
jgi:RNA polymerase sigma-70 factor, ECF subfamily